MAYRVVDDGRPGLAASWSVTLDPESDRRRRTFEVPVEGLLAFVSAAFSRGSRHLLVSDGKLHVRITRADKRIA